MVVCKRQLSAMVTALGGIYGLRAHVIPAPPLSPLASVISPSKTIEIHALTKKMEDRGEEIVSLCVGEPDFQPPPAVLKATIEAAETGKTKYTAVTGMDSLREAICTDLRIRKKLDYEPNQIVVSNGAKQAIYQSVLSIVKPGDKVIIPAPYWPSYPEIVRMAGGVPVIVHTFPEDGFLLSPDALREAISPQTSLVIFCNPSNPTGAVHPPERVRALAGVLLEDAAAGVWALSDEIYERILYGDRKHDEHLSLAAVEGMKERCVLINGFSKSHAMTGYRIGYMAGPDPLAKAVATIQGQITSCASTLGQLSALAALSVSDEVINKNVAGLQCKRDFLVGHIEQMAPRLLLPSILPQGAFYVLPNIHWTFGRRTRNGSIIRSATDFCKYLLTEYSVAFVPGDAFGYPNGVRISYSTSMETIELAMDRLAKFVASLQ